MLLLRRQRKNPDMPGEEKSSSLAQINITQILNQIAMLSAELAVLQARVEDLEQYEGERWQFNPGGEGGGGENYSFKVTRADEDHVEIAPGAFIVVHISRVEKSAAQVAVGLDGYIYSKCVYAGANTEWDDEWTFDTAYPPESPHYKIVVLAEIKNGKIIQRHCGDVEAYPFGEACDE